MKNFTQTITSTVSESISQNVNINKLLNDYSFCIESILYKQHELKKIKKKLKKLHKNIEIETITINVNTSQTFASCPEFAIILTNSYGKLYGDIFGKTPKEANNVLKSLSKFEDKSAGLQLIFEHYTIAGGRLTPSTKIKEPKEFEGISKLYYPFLDTDEFFKQFLNSSSNILILHGEFGLGKSKFVSLFIKYLSEHQDEYEDLGVDWDVEPSFLFFTVKNEDILSDDSFWTSVENNNPSALLLDDLDYMLSSRKQTLDSGVDIQKNKFISQLLSFSDGIVKNNSKTKIIVTTNKELDDIDDALMRKGRLFDILEFRKLSKKEARIIWKENGLKEKIFDELFHSEMIRQSDIANEIEVQLQQKKDGTEYKSYLLDEGVSSMDKMKHKKVGFV